MPSGAATPLEEANLSDRQWFLNDVIEGLSGQRKSLDPKYFYDEAGSRLFEQITGLSEYYITRTETQLMRDIAAELGEACGDTEAIIEFGSGSGLRSDLLLGALSAARVYIPIDVSEELLASTADVVNTHHSGITVLPLVGDFTQDISLPLQTPQRRLGYFPGSTIGNFRPDDAAEFLRRTRKIIGAGSRMLVGVDLVKDHETLENAYNDSKGTTAAFNLNVLRRINRELNADIDLNKFAHQAFFDPAQSRIEMHLVSLADQQVSIDQSQIIDFQAGETIHTENSYKYSVEGFSDLAQRAGWTPIKHWVDENGFFSLHLLEA